MRACIVAAVTAALMVVGTTTAQAAGSNNFRYPTPIPSLPYSAQGDNYSASNDITDPVSSCDSAIHNVWFQYRAPATDAPLVHVTFDAPGWAGQIAVYRLRPTAEVFRASPPTDWEAIGCDETMPLAELTFDTT